MLVEVHLIRNPWPETVSDEKLTQVLMDAAVKARDEIVRLKDTGEVADHKGPFGSVLLDPTRPAFYPLKQRIMAFVLIGDREKALKCLPNGASKADSHNLHGINMGELVKDYNHLIPDGAFAWGYSAEYKHAIGGGSGLSDKQDRDIVMILLEHYVEQVRIMRDWFIQEQRRLHPETGWAWYSLANKPDPIYDDVVELISAPTTTMLALAA